MGFTFNDFIRLAKKAFRFYQKYQKNHQQQGGQQQGGQQQGQQQHHNQNQAQGGAWSQPPQQQQQQHQPYQQQQQYQQGGQQHVGGGGGGGYGSHDGPPTWVLLPKNQDMANAQNTYYVGLRNSAIREGDLMAKCFGDSKTAYSSGDGGRAKNLSSEGKDHQRKKDDFNMQAANWIFTENNKSQPTGSIDVHGLYVSESVTFTEQAVQNARQQGLPILRVIVGKGNHSPSHVAKLRPAIEQMMERQHLTATLEEGNSGVLVVQLQGQSGMGSREIGGTLEKGDTCVVM